MNKDLVYLLLNKLNNDNMEIANFLLLNFRYIILILLFILLVVSLMIRFNVNKNMIQSKVNIKKIHNYISEYPIIVGGVFAIIPALILGGAYLCTSIVHIDKWASFATYTSLGLSITTVIFVLMTYQIQSKSSTVLQFDSTFFQWMGIFLDAVSKDKEHFQKFVDERAKDLLEGIDETFTGNFSATHMDEERTCVRHYKVLYQILRYIHTSEIIHDNEKKKYVDIIQSQLTDEQLLTFFVLLLMDKEKNNERVLGISLMKLMDKYHFFKNLYFPTNKESLGKFLCTNFPETKNSFHWFKENIVDNEQR